MGKLGQTTTQRIDGLLKGLYAANDQWKQAQTRTAEDGATEAARRARATQDRIAADLVGVVYEKDRLKQRVDRWGLRDVIKSEIEDITQDASIKLLELLRQDSPPPIESIRNLFGLATRKVWWVMLERVRTIDRKGEVPDGEAGIEQAAPGQSLSGRVALRELFKQVFDQIETLGPQVQFVVFLSCLGYKFTDMVNDFPEHVPSTDFAERRFAKAAKILEPWLRALGPE